jgi:hypothetical protein
MTYFLLLRYGYQDVPNHMLIGTSHSTGNLKKTHPGQHEIMTVSPHTRQMHKGKIASQGMTKWCEIGLNDACTNGACSTAICRT